MGIFMPLLLGGRKMKWIKKSRSLTKDLATIRAPGPRLKKIREAKNRISDFKGEFGFREVAAKLAESGAIPDDAKGRKIFKEFEEDQRQIGPDKALVKELLSILDVTPKFAGYELEAEQEVQNKPNKSLASNSSQKTKHQKIAITIRNFTENHHTLYVKHYPENNAVEISLYNDHPVPTKDKVKDEHGRFAKDTWIPGVTYKYSDSDKAMVIAHEETVII